MASTDIVKGLDFAVKHGLQVDFDGEKSADLVDAAEITLGVIFPPSYREFLTSLGCGDAAGHEFYGVISPDFINSGVPDAIWLTLRERVDSKLPSRLVIVGAQGDGAYYALDCGRVTEGKECPVIIWWPGASEEKLIDDAEVLAVDFGSFFLDKIKAAF
ncbi:hypothetical protein JM49_02500 [Pseudomonas chlororaphis subsp. aurantiaca]|uniref:SMI1/KNR4 family protein n=1 Tax=Pseudomonas chlororaphis TaxID=587753 RepID=UPI00050D2E0D|nr:SMI1/KNR4 family protein [Pseudomonas chlororaphis]AIS10581.1 hypothetical protein JM49_02500 [Pseudomonas chlororaphis subsp. aurantiaca]